MFERIKCPRFTPYTCTHTPIHTQTKAVILPLMMEIKAKLVITVMKVVMLLLLITMTMTMTTTTMMTMTTITTSDYDDDKNLYDADSEHCGADGNKDSAFVLMTVVSMR